MTRVIMATYDENGIPRHEFVGNDLNLESYPPNGSSLEASVMNLPDGSKLVAIVVPAAAGPAQSSATPAPAPATSAPSEAPPPGIS